MLSKATLPRQLLVGLSGGADSVALAWLLRQRSDVTLTAVHVNHGLRGDASDGDERFVRELCMGWKLPLLVYRAQPPEHPGEDWARQARYAFFRQAMQQTGAQAIALAHHRDDQAETLLLHLLRGAGSTGLAGMAAEADVLGVRVIRPLLGFARQQLREVLASAGLTWREDASNQDQHYLRNALRAQALPLLEQLAPGAARRMACTAQIIREDDDALNQWAQGFLQTHGAGKCLPLASLGELPAAVLHRVLRLWWLQCGRQGDQRGLTRQQTEALAALTASKPGSKCNLPGGMHAYRGWTHLHLPEIPGCVKVTMATAPLRENHGDGRRAQAMPRSLLEACTLRTRQPGDWISPFGMTGKQSLQDYFVNRKVDEPFRDQVLLLCRGSEVLLAAGVGAGAVPPADQTEELILVRWQGDMPWMHQ